MEPIFNVLRNVIGSPPSSVSVAPNLDPKKVQNAISTFAPIGQEAPLVLFDNTVWGSAKKGALVTSHALYVDSSPHRIELGWLVEEPDFDSQGGALRMPNGAVVPIPKMLGDELQETWTRVLSAIVAYNSGINVAATVAPVPGPVGQMASDLLRVPGIDLAPRLSRQKVWQAWANFSDWPDWSAGETLVAFVNEAMGDKGDKGILLTDRRLLAYVDEKQFSIPYAYLQAASFRSTLLGKELVVAAGQYGGTIPMITASDAVPAVASFLQALLSIPPEHRHGLPIEDAPSSDDPSGAHAILARRPEADSRTTTMLRLVHAMTHKPEAGTGWLPKDQALDFAQRVELFAKNAEFGRGMRHGWLLSALHIEDFVAALPWALGQPMHVAGDAMERVLDFPTQGGSGLGRAAASSAVGLASMAILGVGWVSTPAASVRTLRIVVRATQLGCVFMLLGSTGAAFQPLLSLDAVNYNHAAHRIGSLEPLALLHRIALGWEVPSPGLFVVPPAEIESRVRSQLGPVDLSVFDPRAN